jgi:UPF0716 protein FxsA
MILLVALLVIVPIVELFVFVQVADWIGVFQALFLLLALSFVGAWVVKVQGVGVLRRVSADLNARMVPGRALLDGALLLVAGALMLIPGFVSDLFGILLLIPFIRTGIGNGLVRRWTRRFTVRTVRYYDAGPYPNRDPRSGPGDRPELEA